MAPIFNQVVRKVLAGGGKSLTTLLDQVGKQRGRGRQKDKRRSLGWGHGCENGGRFVNTGRAGLWWNRLLTTSAVCGPRNTWEGTVTME